MQVLIHLVTFGMAATLAGCVGDTATAREHADLGASSASDAGSGSDAGSASDAGAGSDAGWDAGCYVPTRLDVTLDRSAIATELSSSNQIIVALTGSGGFGGTATLSASLRGPGGNPLPGWTIALDRTTVQVPQNGTAIAIATVTIPSENRGLIGAARFTVASSAQTGTFAAEATLTAENRITFPIALANNQCIYPSPSTVSVTIGTRLRWLNLPTNPANLAIHVSANPYGIYHPPTTPGLYPGESYEQTVSGTPSTSFYWYCHSPGPFTNNYIQPVN